VDAILDSIEASGQSAPSTGPQITITYDVATGALSAATNTTINSLSGKGWEVFINGVLVIPNILDLAPAAAYSLRSFDSAADPDVVNVRRSSDSATADFKASEVSDGTLTTWVGEQNLITYSNSFVGNWSRTTSSTTTAGQAGYDGTNDATEFYDSRSNSSYGLYKNISSPINGQINASIYLKAGTVSTGQLDLFYVGGSMRAVSFDLSNGTVEAGILGGSAQVADAVGITNVGNGWYRVNLTQDSGSPLLQYFRIGLSSAGTIFIQDAQVVDGASVRTYVETNASQSGDGHVTTWCDQSSNGRNGSQFFASEQPKIVESGALVTEGGLAAVNFHTETSYLFINHTNLYGQATLDSYYVTNATGDAYIYPSLVTNGDAFGMTADYLSGSTTSNNYGSPTYYANGTQITGTTRGDIHTATSGGQKLVTHLGADTTDSRWGTHSMNFGNYGSNATYSYTGKLQEMIFFNTDQSTNRTGIEKNINDTYTIY
jgi:hypothetical protein